MHRNLCIPRTGSFSSALWWQNRQQLVLYVRLHGMVIGPLAACRCLATFTGRFLSIPSRCFQDSVSTASEFARWDTGPLSLLNYCWRAFTSLRALSTLLCLTDIAEARDVEESDIDADFNSAMLSCSLALSGSSQICEPSLISPERDVSSGRNIQMHHLLHAYLLQHSGESAVKSSHADKGVGGAEGAVTLKLARRLELKFRLTGTRLVALHFKAMRGREVMKDGDGREILHVVEVHEGSQLLQHVMATAVVCGFVAPWFFRRQ